MDTRPISLTPAYAGSELPRCRTNKKPRDAGLLVDADREAQRLPIAT